jgi:hypothetical protein
MPTAAATKGKKSQKFLFHKARMFSRVLCIALGRSAN